MSQDKELEIQIQFLEEATDHLNTLEAVLLELNGSSRVDPHKINASMRAAHSIKGGAGMMGFRALADLAHRLEDSFKVLKTRKDLEIDTQLQGLLLSGVDLLRRVAELHGLGRVVEQQWLESFCYPVFDQLHQLLGDPTDEDASSILSPEDGQDIVPLIFQTEVEGCLERLESVLASSDQPCLLEEVSIMAAELGGLGEMLELEAFSQLCESVSEHLTATPDRVGEIAQMALSAWRRSQALILINQRDSLPSAIELPSLTVAAVEVEPAILEVVEVEPVEVEPAILEVVEVEPVEVEPAILEVVEVEPAILEVVEVEPVEVEPAILEPVSHLEAPQLSDEEEEAWLDEVIAANFEDFELLDSEEDETEPVDLPEPTIAAQQTQTTDYKVPPKQEVSASTHKSETQENTVRVPIKQLEQINDLFGELTIQRNGLNLQLERLRKLIRNLTRRIKTLDRENQELREAYDKVTTQAVSLSNVPSSLMALPDKIVPDFKPDEGINNGFDVLEMDRYNDLHLLSQEVMETIVQVQEVTSDIDISLEDTEQVARQLNKTAKQLQNKLTQVRMRPLSDLVDRFPRALREMCVEYGKNVELKVYGGSTLIERNILESLNEPLMHLLRNSFDHGIEDPATRRSLGKKEQGVIEIRASHRSNRTIITIGDDGRGISLDKIRKRALAMGLDASLLAQASDEELLSLIFEPGFSTSDKVTSLSGRGVGMDVVRNNLKLIRGEVTVDTNPGKGTTFTLSVPFTLSVARVLLVESNQMLLAFPTDAISEIFLLQQDRVMTMAGSEALSWQGSMVQLIRLGRHLEFNCTRRAAPALESPPTINAATVLMINTGTQPVALQVERTWGEQEVAIRRVEGDIPMPAGFSNCTILGDGRVVPLVSPNELLHWIASHERTPNSNRLPSVELKAAFLAPPATKAPALLPTQKGTILIVDDSINVRRFLALTLEKAGYQVEQAKDGQDAIEKLLNGLQVQAVICDIEMPRLDGFGFLARVKSHAEVKNIPIAMLTSRSGDKHRKLAVQLGAIAYFSKPYNEQELLQTLEQVIAQPLAEVLTAS